MRWLFPFFIGWAFTGFLMTSEGRSACYFADPSGMREITVPMTRLAAPSPPQGTGRSDETRPRWTVRGQDPLSPSSGIVPSFGRRERLRQWLRDGRERLPEIPRLQFDLLFRMPEY